MDIQYLKGIGEKRAKLFARLGLFTLEDLLAFYPRGYEDRTDIRDIARVSPGESVCVRAIVGAPVSHHRVRAGLEVYKTRVFDETGTLYLTFFNAPYIKSALSTGAEYVFFGKVTGESERLEMTNPVCEPSEKAGRSTGRILPRYRLTADLSQGLMRSAVEQAFAKLPEDPGDMLPDDLRKRLNLCRYRFAVQNIHFPQSAQALALARRRLVFEELLVLQLALSRLKDGRQRQPGYALPPADLSDFYASLPFRLTDDQIAAVDDCLRDMSSGKLTHRLIQGDVGSGKTLVAAACAVSAVRGGAQAALMAPTEILAEQHFETLERLFAGLGIETVLLTGRLTAARKRAAREKISSGQAGLIIGTHALISQGVEFHRLGLTITDEQHRFGVRHQNVLSAKAGDALPAHRVVMSATPIPRTLALIMYGDMDVTVMRGMPPGRRPVRTFPVTEEMRPRIHAFIRKLVNQGQQVYVVCPIIEDERELGFAAAEDYAENLRAKVFPDLSVGLLHGRMAARKKEDTMRAFTRGEIQVLVATTVIEVGVNVPNATLMVIENAERFGLSQLHQLRGRVGRGHLESHCVMFLQSKSETARKRLEIMKSAADGFAIAEADLALRGPGDFFGERQHGLPEFKLADLSADMELVSLAREEARALARSPLPAALEKAVGTLMKNLS
ncbi:MAG: ATP-dependent DNA helicase RecG [Oscillospiraceae bacterium]|nr:ATP-dependent DNA helicase RecG [Oscillospiraceae bacterium]